MPRRKDLPGYTPSYPMIDGMGDMDVEFAEPVKHSTMKRTKHLGVVQLRNVAILENLTPQMQETLEWLCPGAFYKMAYMLPLSGPQASWNVESYVQKEPVILEFEDAYNSPGEFAHVKTAPPIRPHKPAITITQPDISKMPGARSAFKTIQQLTQGD